VNLPNLPSQMSDKKYYVNLDLKFVHFSNSMVMYVRIGDLIRDFGHAYSAAKAAIMLQKRLQPLRKLMLPCWFWAFLPASKERRCAYR
jgi:hypothetical protein